MDESQPLVQFPEPSPFLLSIIAAVFLLLLVAAVAREVAIRRRTLRHRLDREWDSVRGILADRGIQDDDARYLTELVNHAMRREPLRAITTREGFETLAEAEMARNAKLDTHPLEDLGIGLRNIRHELGLDYVPIGHAIHSTRELHEGQWMNISPDVDPPSWTRVMVEDVNEAFVYIMVKDDAIKDPPNLPAGSRIRCSLWRDEDARYTFVTTAATHNSPPHSWRLRHTRELERTQNREDFRVRHDQPIVAGVLNAPREDIEETPLATLPVVTRISGRITSLSAGGCAMVFSQPVARHVLLRIELDVPGVPKRNVEIRIVTTATISGGRYLVRGRFLGLDDDMRDKIARYVLHKQQQRLAAQSKG